EDQHRVGRQVHLLEREWLGGVLCFFWRRPGGRGATQQQRGGAKRTTAQALKNGVSGQPRGGGAHKRKGRGSLPPGPARMGGRPEFGSLYSIRTAYQAQFAQFLQPDRPEGSAGGNVRIVRAVRVVPTPSRDRCERPPAGPGEADRC